MPFFTFDLQVWPWPLTNRAMSLIRNTPSNDTEQFDKVLWSYNNNFSSYGPDKPKNAHFWPLTSKCDLDLWHRVMGLIRDTPTHDTEQFDKVLWRYNNYLSSYGPDKPKNAHFWPLTSKCDLDLWHRVMSLITIHAYSWHWTIWQSFMKIQQLLIKLWPGQAKKCPFLDIWPLSVTLTFDIGPWVLYATRLLMTLNNLTKFYEATTITYQVMARTSQKCPFLTFDL